MKMIKNLVILGVFAALGSAAAQETAPAAGAEASPIAGLRPFERPAGAPVTARFEQTPAWQATAVRGLGEPLTGVGFLKDQGAWYTPFIHPNLLGRYDIRGLHQPPSAAASAPAVQSAAPAAQAPAAQAAPRKE